MKKNVLLLCLSMTKIKDGKDGLYSYAQNEEEGDLVEGYLTNEAPAKSIIKKLNATEERLDEIIIICSDSVQKPVINDENRDKVDELYMKRQENVLDEDKKNFEELTHVKLYESLILRFSQEQNNIYKDNPIEFHEIPVPDDTTGAEVAKAAVEAAGFLKAENGVKINLYIDYNGGQRYMAFMIVSIANLAKVRGVRIKEILTMNYEQKDKDKDYVPIQNMKDVFGCVDLVAGVHEYINYGRTRMLDAYFADAPDALDGTNKIKEILKDMREFSYAMQMCNIEDVRKKSKALKVRLETYRKKATQKKDESSEKAAIYEILFLYVVTDILEGYRTLFESDGTENLPEIIKWCIEKDYIQQAITFYAEQMPAYFCNEHKYKRESGSVSVCVFAPTFAEKKEYEEFCELCENCKNDEYRKKSQISNEVYNTYLREYDKYDKEYGWFIKFLNYSHTYMDKNGNKYTFGQLMYKKPKSKEYKYTARNQNSFYEKKVMDDINSDVNRLIGGINVKRARSDLNEDQLKMVLEDYYTAKKLRNTFNHAAEERPNKIQYAEICIFVNNAMDALREFMNKAVKRK